MFSTRWATALALALTLALLNGCGMEDALQGRVRLINATSEYSTLDLYTEDNGNSDKLVVSATAADSDSGYHDVDRGSFTFLLETGASAVAAAQTSGTIVKQHDYTVLAYLTGGLLQSDFLTEDEDDPDAGKAKLRIFNAASSEAGALDVYLTTNACTALGVTDTAIASNVSSLQTPYTLINAASSGTNWHVCVTGAGSKSDLRLSIPQVTFRSKEIATLVLTHTTGGVLLNAAVLDQGGAYTPYANTISRVRLVADAAASGTVTATVNGVALAVDLPSPTITSYLTVPSGALTTALEINDIAINGVTLPAAAAGGDYTLLVAGSAGAPTVQLLADNNSASTSSSQPVKVRVVDGVNNISGTASGSVAGTVVAANVTFATASAYATIAANSSATVTATGGLATPTPLTAQTFTSSHVYTIFVFGDATAPQIALATDH